MRPIVPPEPFSCTTRFLEPDGEAIGPAPGYLNYNPGHRGLSPYFLIPVGKALIMNNAMPSLFTYDDWLARPETTSFEEVIEGELIGSPTPFWDHATVVANLFRIFDRVARNTGAGHVRSAPLEIRLSNLNVPEPDILFIQANRIKEIVVGRRIVGPPHPVVEVISRLSVRRDSVTRLRLYAEYGIPEYWLIDPAERSARVFALDEQGYQPVLPDDAGGFHSRVMPGLVISGADCFAELEGE